MSENVSLIVNRHGTILSVGHTVHSAPRWIIDCASYISWLFKEEEKQRRNEEEEEAEEEEEVEEDEQVEKRAKKEE